MHSPKANSSSSDEMARIVDLWSKADKLSESELSELSHKVKIRFQRFARSVFRTAFSAEDREDLASEFLIDKLLADRKAAAKRAPQCASHLNSFFTNYCKDVLRGRKTKACIEQSTEDIDSFDNTDDTYVWKCESWFEDSDSLSNDMESQFAEEFMMTFPSIVREMKSVDARCILFHLTQGLQTFAGDETLPRKGDFKRIFDISWNKKLARRLGADRDVIQSYVEGNDDEFQSTPIGRWLDSTVKTILQLNIDHSVTLSQSEILLAKKRVMQRALLALAKYAKIEWELISAPPHTAIRSSLRSQFSTSPALSW
jgi:DNA-directed RNA polymerase specialized sigma24 family protein